jgi:hypothetical protein
MTTATALFTTYRRLRSLANSILFAGGVLWILTFALIVVNGVITGTLPNQPDVVSPPFLRIGIRLFALSVVILGIGLWGFAPRLHGRWLKTIGLLLSTVAMIFSAINLVTLSGLVGTPAYSDTLGGLSVMITSLATLLLGIAAARSPGISRTTLAAMFWIGLSTIPILIFTPLPVGPDWATDFLAFLTSGVAYCVLGRSLPQEDPLA